MKKLLSRYTRLLHTMDKKDSLESARIRQSISCDQFQRAMGWLVSRYESDERQDRTMTALTKEEKDESFIPP